MKVKSKKPRLYNGDNSTQIYVEDDSGRQIIIMNLYRCSLGYNNDRFSAVFRTIKQAKEWTKQNLERILDI
jgi:hypothetical protein